MAFPALHAVRSLPTSRGLVLLAAVAGLFVMHGLTDHGTTHWGAHSAILSSATESRTDNYAMASAHGAHIEFLAASESPDVGLSDSDGGLPAGWGLAGLCMAVVGLAGLSISVFIRARRTARCAGVSALSHLDVQPVRLSTADPPGRHLLQVHRC